MYSLGVVLHEMLTGGVPFEAETPMAVSMKHVNEPPPSLRETNPRIPEGLNAVRSKLMAKNPEDRYRSAAEVAEDLRRIRRGKEPVLASPALAAQDAPTGVLPRPPIAVQSRRRRWRPFVLRTAAALVGVSGLVGVFGWGLSDSEGRQPEDVIQEARQVVAGENEVSSVVGLDRVEAQRRLIGEGFEVDVRMRESSEEEAGAVLAQSIPGGREAEKGTEVVLDVGDGPTPVPVPELAGLDLAGAEDVLAEAGLEVGEKREEPSETVPEGVVIEQNPPVGEKIDPGTPVDLVLSTGPAAPPPATPAPEPPPAEAAPAEPVAPPAEPAPEPTIEPVAEPPDDQYEPETRQYEEPAERPAPAEQYDEPPGTAPTAVPPAGTPAPAGVYVEPGAAYVGPAPPPEDGEESEGGEFEGEELEGGED
ncbi:PASTA domain-containing protein [Rubrobacter marinus]|uniref:PASTA domain-containing protein n=1 Tax=Rubrobacter marinus TaxID=2653852 RepID=UPI00140A52D8|nr:PASTA domain-containing protein [Rubrobacter marinus]